VTMIAGRDAIIDASAQKAAVAAFNIFNLESVLAVGDAAAETGAPVLCQVSHSAAAMHGWQTLADTVHAVARGTNARIALHLDHGQSKEDVERALALGFTSIMYDGSAAPLGENIDATREIIALCAEQDIQVEGEVGVVGTVDDLASQPVSDVDEVIRFVDGTGCDLVAIAIGNAHGFYAETPKLDLETLRSVAEKISIPVVLHGASGISDADIRTCIDLGVRKINYATELRAAFARGYGAVPASDTDPRPALKSARAAMKEFCIRKIRLLGWNG